MEHKLQFGSTACENGTFVKKQTLQILAAPLFPGISWEILERVWNTREKASAEMPWMPLRCRDGGGKLSRLIRSILLCIDTHAQPKSTHAHLLQNPYEAQ